MVVISGDRFNASAIGTITVALLTSTAALAAVPRNVAVPAEVSGLDGDSVVNVAQLATIDRLDVGAQAGALPASVMSQVDDGLRKALDLTP